jgi:hypothetical protein
LPLRLPVVQRLLLRTERNGRGPLVAVRILRENLATVWRNLIAVCKLRANARSVQVSLALFACRARVVWCSRRSRSRFLARGCKYLCSGFELITFGVVGARRYHLKIFRHV